jgi:hypothetical protein
MWTTEAWQECPTLAVVLWVTVAGTLACFLAVTAIAVLT